MNKATKQSKYSIRPSSRIIKTIGRDLIKDVHAAIVELVKNSYDADSPEVLITFHYKNDQQRLVIIVEDQGHGMNFDTVVNKWLVPATSDKLNRKISDKGRVLQGRKGIGRFAATTLGERVLLETTTDNKTTSLILDLDDLDKSEYLDEFDIDIVEDNTNLPNGTKIEIEKDRLSEKNKHGITEEEVNIIWSDRQLEKLLTELRRLISPEDVYKEITKQGYEIKYDSFSIKIKFRNFPNEKYNKKSILIKPFPIMDLYDYRISGKINQDGFFDLKYTNQNTPKLPKENIKLNLGTQRNDSHGDIFVDIRVYDRDPEGITNIISRGLKDPDTGHYLGKREARKTLDEYYGISIYRGQFSIRPYGDQDFDWLGLDKSRVQNPSIKIGHNQTIGYIYIQPEEKSNLVEKSARDGLVENSSYVALVENTLIVINELASRRALFRKNIGKGRTRKSLQEEIDELYDFESVQDNINNELKKIGIEKSSLERINKTIAQSLNIEKTKKSSLIDKIRNTIAIYQGQATLGKITHVLLHEGRKNIKYLNETIPRVLKWSASDKPSEREKATDRSSKVLLHLKHIERLFKKIEPLARTRRAPDQALKLNQTIESCFSIFETELNSSDITYRINASQEFTIKANEIDIITIFSNLIENSIYWINYAESQKKTITISIDKQDTDVEISYRDSGPGFQGNNLELMFEPGYSLKKGNSIGGTGLGLSLAGEAAARLDGTIESLFSDDGALFKIILRNKLNA